MESRRETNFIFEPRFKKTLRNVGVSNSAKIMDDITKFQEVWQNSASDDDFPKRYNFHPYRGVSASYSIYQIYVGPRQCYRAAFILYDGHSNACWIHVFKKERDNERQEVNLAIERAS